MAIPIIMADRLEPHIHEAFREETRRVMARRAPAGVAFFLVWVVIAGLLEGVHFPGRTTALLWSFGLELVLCLTFLAVAHSRRLRRYVIPVGSACTLGVIVMITLYVTYTGASGDALAGALVIFLTGVPLLLPWGLAGQLPLALGTVAVYMLTRSAGVPGELPLAYSIICIVGGATSSVVGAYFLDVLRRAIFRQRILLEQTRDQQMAMLYEVTRTVTGTLELQQVLWLVCQGVLDALKLDRLWLFWREAPEGDLRGLQAERTGSQAGISELPGDHAAWEALLEIGSKAAPEVHPPVPAEAAALGVQEPPVRLLRLPLFFQSELVGVILADCGTHPATIEASFLDFAATLGNSAAMAIANARLHALVLQHRRELQQMSNKRLDVIEEGLRRLSRELHDGTCQALMAIKLDLALLQRQLPAEPAALHAAVHDLRAQVVDVVQGVRQMSHLLRPAVLDDFGAVAAIQSMAEKYREADGVDVRVEGPEQPLRFPPSLELLIFRVFQESMINISKHAQATRVQVRVVYEDGAVVLAIDDNGRGFDAHAYFRAPPTSAGLGLIGMRERVAHFGGIFRVTSRPGAGTHLFVSLPVEPVAAPRVAAAL